MVYLFRPSRTLRRYVLYQIPGWILAIIGAGLLHHLVGLSTSWGIMLVGSWVIKDAALYPFLRTSYNPDSPSPIEKLVGLQGIAAEPLAPKGYINVRGELWLAEAYPRGTTIEQSRPVIVDSFKGRLLLVRPATTPQSAIASPSNA